LDSIVKAAAVHAWIAHIHPFDDGNGRIARLLANMVLAREFMPPLILRNKGDRARYIDALAFSDEAGDISRLILVFCRSIERVINELNDPLTAQEYFKADIDLRLSGEYKVWKNALEEWTNEALVQLKFTNLKGEIVGEFNYTNYIQNFSYKYYNGEGFSKVLLYCDINNIKLKIVDNYYVYEEYRFNFIDCRFDEFLKIVKQNFIII
jgi:hypothetical protein